MNASHDLPIIFGVTGHRDLRPEDEPILAACVRDIFERFRNTYPCTRLLLFTPLAVGADRLVARVAVDLGIPFYVPMPLEEREYRKDFSSSDDAGFCELAALSEARYAMNFVADNTADNVADPARRDRQYARLASYLASTPNVLIALWNGKASDAIGGTAQVVQYRLNGSPASFRSPTALLDDPDIGPVYHVVTPRRSDPGTDAPAGSLYVLTPKGRVAPSNDPRRKLYEKFDRFNRDWRRLEGSKRAPTAATRLSDVAEKLATRYQRLARVTLNWMFVLTGFGAISLAFAHRDRPLYAAVLPYCITITIAFFLHRIAEARRWKERSIEYRAFEIALTIQRVWDLVDVRASVADFYLHVQRSEFDWIREALRNVWHLSAGQLADPKLGVVAVHDFVSSQREFFSIAAPRDEGLSERYKILTNVSVSLGAIISIALFAITVGHLLAPEGPSPVASLFGPLWGDGDFLIRGIAIATILAALAHEYPRRRAFHAQARRYTSMLQIYERALERLDAETEASLSERLQVTSEVIREVGLEALAENGEWLMMHRELPMEPIYV